VLYIAMFTVVYSVFLFYAEKTKMFTPASFQASTTYPIIQPLGPKIINGFARMMPIFKDTFAQLEQFFDSVSDKIEH
jgi:membrane protein required for colicin V production